MFIDFHRFPLSIDNNHLIATDFYRHQFLSIDYSGISDILAKIVNLSVTSGSYPPKLKKAKVIPGFKTEDETGANNYTPISLLSIFDRIFQKIMYKRMMHFINVKNILFSAQCGFIEGFSTEHTIVNIVTVIQSNVDKRSFTCGIFIDLKKAFDTVNHQILLNTLNLYGFRGIINNWFESFLCNRSQTLEINKQLSDAALISNGVPQGSVLGLLLFLLYTNDIHTYSDAFNFYFFADDTNILYANKNLRSLEPTLNSELKKLYLWLVSNKLTLNTKKPILLFLILTRSLLTTFSNLRSSILIPINTLV